MKLHEWKNMWERLDRTVNGVCGQGMTLGEYAKEYDEMITEGTSWSLSE